MILCTGIMVRIWQHLECPGVIMSVYTCHVVPPTRYPTDLYICLHIHNSMSLSLVYKYRFSMSLSFISSEYIHHSSSPYVIYFL